MRPVLLLIATALQGSLVTALPAQDGPGCVQCAQPPPDRDDAIAPRTVQGRLSKRAGEDGGGGEPSSLQAGKSDEEVSPNFRDRITFSDKGRADLSRLNPAEKKAWRLEKGRASEKKYREKVNKMVEESKRKGDEVRQMGNEGRFADMDDEQWKKFLQQEAQT